jgi:CRP/FNR family transcriptional regulator, transcriptional activator FtrB
MDEAIKSYSEIRSFHLFANMSDENFSVLMRRTYLQNFPPQVELMIEGEQSDFLHVLLTGSVELSSSWNNRQTTISTITPISTFILAASIKDTPYLMSAKTLEKSCIALIPSANVRRVFDIDHHLARAVVTELAQCYSTVVKAQKDLKLRSSLERLANHLLRQQHLSMGKNKFELKFEKKRLASLLGMTPENLSRAFKSLQPYGVKVHRNQITISHWDKLVNFAKPSPLIDDLLF